MGTILIQEILDLIEDLLVPFRKPERGHPGFDLLRELYSLHRMFNEKMNHESALSNDIIEIFLLKIMDDEKRSKFAKLLSSATSCDVITSDDMTRSIVYGKVQYDMHNLREMISS